jgi:hypothetical protein
MPRRWPSLEKPKPRVFHRTLFLQGRGQLHFITAFKGGTEEAVDRKAKSFLSRLMRHPAQREREYVIR